MPHVEQDLLTIPEHLRSPLVFWWGSCCLLFSFLCCVVCAVVCLSFSFLAMALSVCLDLWVSLSLWYLSFLFFNNIVLLLLLHFSVFVVLLFSSYSWCVSLGLRVLVSMMSLFESRIFVFFQSSYDFWTVVTTVAFIYNLDFFLT